MAVANQEALAGCGSVYLFRDEEGARACALCDDIQACQAAVLKIEEQT